MLSNCVVMLRSAWARPIGLLCVMVLLAGCAANTVVIKYRALMNTDKIVGGPPSIVAFNPGAVDGKVLLVYCISEIANTAAKAADFTFDPAKLYVTSADSAVLIGNQFSWAWTATSVFVAKGTTLSDIGRIIIRTPRSANEKLNPTSMSLFYGSGANESVLMSREPATDPVFTGALGPLEMGQFLDANKIGVCQNTKQ